MTSNRFTVKGSGSFPYVLLQRGKCYPEREVDVDSMFNYTSSRTINLIGFPPNEDSWRSFGWMVISQPPFYKEEYVKYHTWPC